MEQSPASKSHFWAALFKPHISILDISAEEEGPHLIGDYLRPLYQQQDARTAPCPVELFKIKAECATMPENVIQASSKKC